MQKGRRGELRMGKEVVKSRGPKGRKRETRMRNVMKRKGDKGKRKRG